MVSLACASLAILEKALGRKHPNVAVCLEAGHGSPAMDDCGRVRAISPSAGLYERSRGQAPDLARGLATLAMLQQGMGRLRSCGGELAAGTGYL